MLRWLTAERRPAVLYLVAGVFGFGLAWYLLGWEGIHGTSHYWETTHNDSLQGIAALRYYLAEPWSWSILDVRSYGVPDGTNLILSDSIPILAVAFKLISGVLPAGFHYFGYWIALCFVMQVVSAVAILVELRWRNGLAVVAAAGFALTQTVLLGRFFHVALMAQFLILLTILFGIRLVRGEKKVGALWALLGLLAATFFVHLYLFAMTAVLAAAFVVQAGSLGEVPWRRVAVWLAAAVIGSGVFVAMTGLATAASATAGGLGYYSMNALAPVAGNIDATGGQYEGYSYLGLGALVVVLVALVLGRDQVAAAARRYWMPMVVGLLMAVYALSPVVWVGMSWQFDVPWWGPLAWLGERFRSTGRFSWPIVYLVLIGALYLAYKRLGTRWAAYLLIGAAAIQVADMAPLVSEVREIFTNGDERLLAAEPWTEAIASHDLVRIPPQECLVALGDPALANREVQRITAQTGVPVTAAAVARQQANCDDPVFAQAVAPGELRVVWTAVDPGYSVAGAFCVDFDLGTACTAAATGPSAEAVARLGAG